jgi:hypothetical protein
MKKLVALLAVGISFISISQNMVLITPENYNILKQNGQLSPTARYVFPSSGNQQVVHANFQQIQESKSRSSACNCLIDLDTTFQIVPFVGAFAPEYRNDDFSTDKIGLPFSFNFYGIQYDSLYINNNGNISFISPYATYTANAFPDSTNNMIAPFWGDVDTRDSINSVTSSGLVYYKITPTAMIVKWENVGYFNVHSDLRNTFQLIITNGNDSIVPNGNNVSFCYGDMNWTTGDASDGVAGFGGSPATVGVNQGDGVNYFQVGTFDAAGTGFDGPYNGSDQVDFLDNQEVYFNLANLGNVAPLIINEYICDTIDVYTGDTLKKSMTLDSLVFALSVMTPEINQNVTATISCSVPSKFTYDLTKDTPTFKEYTCTLNVKHLLENSSSNLVYITTNASDDGLPVASSSQTIVVRVNFLEAGINDLNSNEIFSISPNPMNESISIQHTVQFSENPVLNIVDISGKNLKSEKLTSFNQTVDVSNLNSGIYLVSIHSNNGITQNVKIIKE